jgi:nucleotide-binding universal stress UspA family protein
MFEHILVPLRLGTADAALIEPALGLARLSPAEVTLVHVVEKVAGMPAAEVRRFHERLVEKARRNLDRTAKAFSREGIPVRVEVLLGTPPAEVVRYATKHGVDLIVMGSHCVRADSPGGWGTTSYKVGLLCQCPVFLVKDLLAAEKRRPIRKRRREPRRDLGRPETAIRS